MRVYRMDKAADDYDKQLAIARRLTRGIHATMDHEMLLMENRQNSFYDRIERGMSPWGAETSRYAPEEADEE